MQVVLRSKHKWNFGTEYNKGWVFQHVDFEALRISFYVHARSIGLDPKCIPMGVEYTGEGIYVATFTFENERDAVLYKLKFDELF